MEQYEVTEILIKMQKTGEDKTKPKIFQEYLDLWEKLQQEKEHKIWCNNQPIQKVRKNDIIQILWQ